MVESGGASKPPPSQKCTCYGTLKVCLDHFLLEGVGCVYGHGDGVTRTELSSCCMYSKLNSRKEHAIIIFDLIPVRNQFVSAFAWERNRYI